MIYAILGAVFLLFAGVGFLAGAGLWLPYLHLVAGLSMVGYALFTSAAELRDLAGRDASRRGARLGANAFVQTLALAVILGGIAVISVRYPFEWDWTDSGVHTLAEATTDVLAQIPEERPVEVYAFFTSGSEIQVRDLLERYVYESDRISFAVHDPQRRPDLAERFEITQNAIVLVCSGPCDTAEATARVVDVSEEQLTRAVRSVISDQKKVYFLSGHGEGAIDDEQSSGYSVIKAAMEAENLIVEPLLLANADAVPEDADAVVVAGPTHSLLARELAALDEYLRAGGSVGVLSDPIVITSIEQTVKEWGVALGNDIIVDQTVELFSGPRIGVEPVVSDYGEHPITKNMEGAATLFPLARSVQAANGDEVVELAMTSTSSWAETDVELFVREQKVGPTAELDTPGPISLAVARVFPIEDGEQREGRLVVVGDADFARNRHVAKVYNADLFLNIVNWLVGEEAFITIDRKTPRASMAQMTRQEFATFQYTAIFFVPEAILLAGIISWWRRRS